MNITSTKPVQDDLYPQGVVRVDFKSEYDGKNDWRCSCRAIPVKTQ